MQIWPVFSKPPQAGGVDRALDVGVAGDDHRVLAAELEADRGQRVGRALHDDLPGALGAGELHEVALVDERAAGLADPVDDVEDVGRADVLAARRGRAPSASAG